MGPKLWPLVPPLYWLKTISQAIMRKIPDLFARKIRMNPKRAKPGMELRQEPRSPSQEEDHRRQLEDKTRRDVD
jgi:hypothetical protein